MSYRYRTNPRERLTSGRRRGFGSASFGYGAYGHGGYEALDNRHVYNYRVGRQVCPQANRNVSSVPPVDKEILKVEEIDFNIATNTRSHKTMEYDIVEGLPMASPHLVVRRGQPFDIMVYFNRAYNAKMDDLRLNFDIGDQPMVNKKTHVDFILSDKDLPKQWGAKGKPAKDNALSLKIFTPPDLYIGKWRFTVDIVKKGKEDDKDSVHRFSKEEPIYILFNPWNPDDQVYMPDTNKLNEYILNQMGKIYIGNCKQISSRQWNFGQFESVILDCAIDLLDDSNMPMTSRGDAVQMARKISALVNAPDDDGILVGNWSGNYRGGNSPQSWLGSVAIIEQFYRSKSPVQFGQCWVFSGLVTTICRALGLPVRSVTNFASAHDSDGSITIDCHFNDIGEPLDEYNHDSVWNFHVWNDVWMARPDLPAGYGGWQAIDATPQERSDGVFCAGPMSLIAIKKGEVTLPYDGPFLFAEVNADKVMWVQCGSSWRKILKKGVIGKKISTKKCSFRMAPVISCNSRQDDPDREDVTGEYKYPEESVEERYAVQRANQTGSLRNDVYDTGPEDVTFQLQDLDEIALGKDFEVVLCVTNKSKEARTIFITLASTVVFYTGLPSSVIKSAKFELKLPPGKDGQAKKHIKCSDYLDKLVDHCQMKISCFARVKETNQLYTDQDDFRLRKPHLTMKVPKQGRVGAEFEVEVGFVNPLPVALSSCSLSVEGPGLQSPLKLQQPNIGANQTFVTHFKLTPRKAGDRELCACFNSSQVEGITGHCSLTVTA